MATVEPTAEDLVRYGVADGWPVRRPLPGPDLSLSGGVAVADPWWPEMLPREPVADLGPGPHPVVVSTVALPEARAVAVAVGDVARAVTWQPGPIAVGDSALLAVVDVAHHEDLRARADDEETMSALFRATSDHVLAPVEIGGAVVGVAVECPSGQDFPVHLGLDASGVVVAVLVDLLVLRDVVPPPLRLSLPFGGLAVADPAQSDGWPRGPVCALPHDSTVQLTTDPPAVVVGDATGATWHPLGLDDVRAHLTSGSGLGLVYDVTDTARLQPLLADPDRLRELHAGVAVDALAPLEVDGRVVGVAFDTGGPGSRPLSAAHHPDGYVVAVRVELSGPTS